GSWMNEVEPAGPRTCRDILVEALTWIAEQERHSETCPNSCNACFAGHKLQQAFEADTSISEAPAIWTCKIGEVDRDDLCHGADAPMRTAVEMAYRELTGR